MLLKDWKRDAKADAKPWEAWLSLGISAGKIASENFLDREYAEKRRALPWFEQTPHEDDWLGPAINLIRVPCKDAEGKWDDTTILQFSAAKARVESECKRNLKKLWEKALIKKPTASPVDATSETRIAVRNAAQAPLLQAQNTSNLLQGSYAASSKHAADAEYWKEAVAHTVTELEGGWDSGRGSSY
jgi:hypothetical protein